MTFEFNDNCDIILDKKNENDFSYSFGHFNQQKHYLNIMYHWLTLKL